MRLTTTDIDAALRDMARRDNYDARYLHTDRLLHDVLPCEDEGVPEIVTEYRPEVAPRIGRGLKLALIVAGWIVGAVVVAVACDWIFTRNGW